MPSRAPTLDDPAAFAELVALAHRLADAGGRAALARFRSDGLATDNKVTGGFDPVTAADRASEAAMRALLADARPEDGILGEEEAAVPTRSGLTWILDPIDGTRAFISGLPTWGVLIALDDGEAGRIGLVEQPYTGERFLGTLGPDGPAARLCAQGGERRIGVRSCPGLAEATLFATAPEMFAAPGEAERFAALRGEVRLARYGIDCYAYALLALGQIDLVVEAGLAAYDIAAPAALVRAAGGIVTDWEGREARWGGRVIAAGDARVHAAALARLSGLG